MRYAEKEDNPKVKQEKREETERYLSLYPFTANLISIGLLNTETEGSLVLFKSEADEEWKVEEKKITYKGNSEIEILKLFWKFISQTDKVITFNEEILDIPLFNASFSNSWNQTIC